MVIGFWLFLVVVVVEILTTEGINLSARSAKDAGTDCEFKLEKIKLKNNIPKNVFLMKLI